MNKRTQKTQEILDRLPLDEAKHLTVDMLIAGVIGVILGQISMILLFI